MFKITLKNNKVFSCEENQTIFEAAKLNGIALEHSCLKARCRSCVVNIVKGDTKDKLDDLVLSPEDKKQKITLSCNAIPTSDVILDVEDLGDVILYEKKIVPAKINLIENITKDVIKVVFRLPPASNFKFNSGQYVNLIKGNLSRSYSVSNNSNHNNQLEFFIKKYENGLMSKYWFEEAKLNDLLRVEGPSGSFFLRKSKFENIIFLATGTGVAPIKSILDSIRESSIDFKEKKFWLFVGARFKEDLFWEPAFEKYKLNIKYIPVLSREKEEWEGEKGYVQDVGLKQNINLENAQVYACGSNEMIQSAKKVFIQNSLKENNFFSDAFVQTN